MSSMRKLSSRAETALVIGLGFVGVLLVAQWTIAAGQRMARVRGITGANACAIDLNRLGLAMIEYTQDSDEMYPPDMQTQPAFQADLMPFIKDPTVFVCPDTGLAYIPNGALSGQSLASLVDPHTTEVARDAAPHEDNETAIVHADGSVTRGGLPYYIPTLGPSSINDPNQIVVNNARQLALAVAQYTQDSDEVYPPMKTPQEFDAALLPFVRNQSIFSTPTGSLFIPNAALDHIYLGTIIDPQSTILFQDAPPYVGGHPTIAYADGHVTHIPAAMPLLWANTDGTAAVWNLSDAAPDRTYALYGPYSGWTPKAVAQGPNGNTRLLWTNSNGRVALWNLADTHPGATCLEYGPYPGWTAMALAVGPDNAAHLLWDNADGRVSLWNTADVDPTATNSVAGPYPGWHGTALSIGPDNHVRLLWNNQDGRNSVWNLGDANPAATYFIGGPYPGWIARSLAVGPDNAAYLLWDNVSGEVAVWDLKDSRPSDDCLLYGPYTGWTATGLSVGSDNSLRLQWNHTDGQVSIWNLDDLRPDLTYRLYGGYPGWTAQPGSAP
jgi:prepilin-type processing-associated H-X9-DG protein